MTTLGEQGLELTEVPHIAWLWIVVESVFRFRRETLSVLDISSTSHRTPTFDCVLRSIEPVSCSSLPSKFYWNSVNLTKFRPVTLKAPLNESSEKRFNRTANIGRLTTRNYRVVLMWEPGNGDVPRAAHLAVEGDTEVKSRKLEKNILPSLSETVLVLEKRFCNNLQIRSFPENRTCDCSLSSILKYASVFISQDVNQPYKK